jgi:hypothetical protein
MKQIADKRRIVEEVERKRDLEGISILEACKSLGYKSKDPYYDAKKELKAIEHKSTIVADTPHLIESKSTFMNQIDAESKIVETPKIESNTSTTPQKESISDYNNQTGSDDDDGERISVYVTGRHKRMLLAYQLINGTPKGTKAGELLNLSIEANLKDYI